MLLEPVEIPDDVMPELRDELQKETPHGNEIQYTPGDRVPCPECGKTVSVTKAGALRGHKCDATGSVLVKTARSGARKTAKATPVNVKKWSIRGLTLLAEYSAESVIVSTTGADRKEIPDAVTALPNPDKMIGPVVDLIWPTIPPSVRNKIATLLEHDAMIEACMYWYMYSQTLKEWSDEYRSGHPTMPVRNGAETNVAVASSAIQFGPYSSRVTGP